MSGQLHVVEQGGDWAGPQLAQSPPCCTKCNSPLQHDYDCNNNALFIYLFKSNVHEYSRLHNYTEFNRQPTNNGNQAVILLIVNSGTKVVLGQCFMQQWANFSLNYSSNSC